MTSTDDRIAALRAELAGLTGAARCGPLLSLAHILTDRYWRAGPGQPQGRADLDAAIEAMSEAYRRLDPGDQHRGRVAHGLGLLLGTRHLAHHGPDQDRDDAMRFLTEALDTPLPPAAVMIAELVLGQLYLIRSMRWMATGSPMALRDGAPPDARADADRALTLLRRVAASQALNDEMAGAVRATLTVAESAREAMDGLTGGLANLDIGRLQKLLATMQRLQEQMTGSGRSPTGGFPGGAGFPGAGFGGGSPLQPILPNPLLLDGDALARMDPLDRPVPVFHGTEPDTPPVPQRPRPAAVSADLAALRRSLAGQVAELAGAPADDASPDQAYRWAATLLRPDGPAPGGDAVDEYVALATAVVHETRDDADPAAGLDRFLLAVALFLRSRADHDGWGDDGWGDPSDSPADGDGPGNDLLAGAEHLLAAVERIPPEHPAALPVLCGLGAFLDDRQPLRGLPDATAQRFAARAEAVAAAHAPGSAVVRALREVCRAAVAVRAGALDELAEVGEAVAAVPADHPWRFRLQVAAGSATLARGLAAADLGALLTGAALVGAGASAAPAAHAAAAAVPGRLAAVLAALVDGDAVALRAATDRLADLVDPASPARADAPALHALLGALRLTTATAPLADPHPAGDVVPHPAGDVAPAAAAGSGGPAGPDSTRDGVGEGADLDGVLSAAIVSLTLATARLTAESEVDLRTGAWWRLAEAYQRRGAAGDLERARTAATRALAAGGRDAAGPARFAATMLDHGGAYEAFEALEAVAVAAPAPVAPLVRDVAAVLLGSAGPAGASRVAAPALPTPAEVAAGLRALGASALLYLHPVGDREHRVGALLLDAETGRPHLLGTVALADPRAATPTRLDERAWHILAGPLLARPVPDGPPRRVLVAATGPLGRLPLTALPAPTGGYAGDDLVFSSVASGRQVVVLAGRTPLPVTRNVVFVANPRGDRDTASYQTMVLRRIFHPDSTGLGRTVERVHGAGTPAEVLAHLPGPAGPGAGLLHLDCALRATGVPALELAVPGGPDEPDHLDVDQLRGRAAAVGAGGGLVVLPADVGVQPDRWVLLADALIGAGVTGVVGWLWPVPTPVAGLMLFLLHQQLVDEGHAPATAVHRVQRWMRDPARVVASHLPAGYAATLSQVDLTDPAYWAALCHRGR